MPTPQQDYLGVIVYAPALVGDDSRLLAAVRGVERALAGSRLEWTISDEVRFISLPQRDAWVAQEMREGEFPLLCNGDESFLVTIHGLESSARRSPGGQAQFEVHAQLPLDPAGIAAASEVLANVAEGAAALWGHASPHSMGGELAQQMRRSAHGPEHSPRGLPMLQLPKHIPSPEIPQYLGWLNYWSPATARAIGFPDPGRDADLLSRSRRTSTGGWIVRLTETPLDLDNPVHLEALLHAYERFPEIGGRRHFAPR
jgi:hypothetical protein